MLALLKSIFFISNISLFCLGSMLQVRAAEELGASHANAKHQQQQNTLAGMLGAPDNAADGSDQNADEEANLPPQAEVQISAVASAAARAVREGGFKFAWDYATAAREGAPALEACQLLAAGGDAPISSKDDDQGEAESTAGDEAFVSVLFRQAIRWLAFGREEDDENSENSGAQKTEGSIEVDVSLDGESHAAGGVSAHSWKTAATAASARKNRRFIGSPGAVAAMLVLQGECARNLDATSSTSGSGSGKSQMLSLSALESVETALSIASASSSSSSSSVAMMKEDSGRAWQLYARALLDANR